MPRRVTMARAMRVTRSRSLAAPEVMSLKTNSSAARPPNKPTMSASIFLRPIRVRSSSGSAIV